MTWLEDFRNDLAPLLRWRRHWTKDDWPKEDDTLH